MKHWKNLIGNNGIPLKNNNMVLFLYSDKNCEHQAIGCIKSLGKKVEDDVKIVYYTIGFDSEFEFTNLHKIRIPYKPEYPRFHFYKADLSLLTMNLFPGEYYAFTDTDVLFSKRFSFDRIKHNNPYPLASYGPHEYPYIWEIVDGNYKIYNETKMMNYFNVSQRSQRYVWSCFYSFNSYCTDFFEEYISMCKNQYLQKYPKEYFPYADETPFNICLWKRGVINNLGFSFVNTNNPEVVRKVESLKINNSHVGENIDSHGADWEYIHNSDDVLLYHGFKNQVDIDAALSFIEN